MECKYCGEEMDEIEHDYDNPYMQYDIYSCSCGVECKHTWWGLSSTPEEEWTE